MADDEGGGSTAQRPNNGDYGVERRREVRLDVVFRFALFSLVCGAGVPGFG